MNRYGPGRTSRRYCGACGESIAASAEFCPRCGRAQATTVETATGWRWLYGLDGRVNRRGFLLREVISIALMSPGFALGLANSNEFLLLVFGAMYLAGLVGHVSACVRRAHDFGWSGWTCLVFLLGFTSMLWTFGWVFVFPYWVMLLVRSNSGESNDHGQCPGGSKVGL